LSNFNFSSEDLSSLEEDERVNYKKKECDFTGLCLMAKGRSSRNNSDSNSDSDFDVSDDLIYDGLSFKVHKVEDALCSQAPLALWAISGMFLSLWMIIHVTLGFSSWRASMKCLNTFEAWL
jgi:hypothetical protein